MSFFFRSPFVFLGYLFYGLRRNVFFFSRKHFFCFLLRLPRSSLDFVLFPFYHPYGFVPLFFPVSVFKTDRGVEHGSYSRLCRVDLLFSPFFFLESSSPFLPPVSPPLFFVFLRCSFPSLFPHFSSFDFKGLLQKSLDYVDNLGPSFQATPILPVLSPSSFPLIQSFRCSPFFCPHSQLAYSKGRGGPRCTHYPLPRSSDNTSLSPSPFSAARHPLYLSFDIVFRFRWEPRYPLIFYFFTILVSVLDSRFPATRPDLVEKRSCTHVFSVEFTCTTPSNLLTVWFIIALVQPLSDFPCFFPTQVTQLSFW